MTTGFSAFTAHLREFIGFSCHEHAKAWTPTVGVLPSGCSGHAPEPARFDLLALELFALQFEHNAPYRRLCEARGVSPANVAGWPEIPAMPASAFKELDLTCLPPARRTAVFHSSGTTEQRPSRHFHSAESLAVYEASLWPWFRSHLIPDKLKLELQPSGAQVGVQALACGHSGGTGGLAILTPPPAQAPHSSLVHMFETVRRKVGAPESVFVGRTDADGSWTLDFDTTLAALSPRAPSLAPQTLLLLGTAFSFVHLLDFLRERNLSFQLPTGSRVMETGGYKGLSRSLPKLELHALITRGSGFRRHTSFANTA